MAMAIFRLVIMSSSIFLLLVAAAATVADDNLVFCHDETSRCDAGTALSLVADLAYYVSHRSNQRYCNVQLSATGWNMYGYGFCSTNGRLLEASACQVCLSSAGTAVVDQCLDKGGAGEVWGPKAWCYIKIGLTEKC